MEIINLCEHDSLVSRYMLELRDKNIQTDRLRFRTNKSWLMRFQSV